MFWKQKKLAPAKPLAVMIEFQVNYASLAQASNDLQIPSSEGMINAWDKMNTRIARFGVLITTDSDNNLMLVPSSQGMAYRDFDFSIDLPELFSKKTDKKLHFTRTDNLVFIAYDELAVMAVPFSFFVSQVLGEPLVDYGILVDNAFGRIEETIVNVYSDSGDYDLKILSNISQDRFSYENTAIKLFSKKIYSNDIFPLITAVTVD
ncbi:hypothetical protein [Dasania marina]|uniref:hypothetical protein n=1 Tax=Dasania marina TaxID=471499 RepID=UPI0030D854B5|tara:strand:- start:4414 stop:5031 length:618 start_codon:yes stop_codon:yes gene_type:complete